MQGRIRLRRPRARGRVPFAPYISAISRAVFRRTICVIASTNASTWSCTRSFKRNWMSFFFLLAMIGVYHNRYSKEPPFDFTRADSARWGEARRALPDEGGRELPPLNGPSGV